MSANKETFGKTVGIVVAVCLACSIVVSTAAVGLRSLQQSNELKDKQTNILEAAGLLAKTGASCNIACTYEKFVEERFIDLDSGDYVERDSGYDMYKAAKQADGGEKPVPDTAGIIYRPHVASVYLVRNEQGSVERVVLPVHGSGLWDIMYGFLALDKDGVTAREMVYYQHKETPGLGAEVLNPAWKALWDGKQLFNNGEVAISIKKNAGDDPYAVDALSGATLTSKGVQNTLDYWLGNNGFGPYIAKQPWKS